MKFRFHQKKFTLQSSKKKGKEGPADNNDNKIISKLSDKFIPDEKPETKYKNLYSELTKITLTEDNKKKGDLVQKVGCQKTAESRYKKYDETKEEPQKDLTQEELIKAIRKDEIENLITDMNEIRAETSPLEHKMNFMNDVSEANTCKDKKDCKSCLEDSHCGWCNQMKLCVIGNHEGPFIGSCEDYNFGICSDSKCKRYKDCNVMIFH